MNIQIDQCMHLKKQVRGFSIKKEKLIYLIFVHFINPITISYRGEMTRMGTNSCYICTAGMPLHYVAEHHSMLHNFVHFRVDDESELEALGLPLNTPFYSDMQEQITDTIEKMEWSKSAWEPEILPPAAEMFEQLLRRLAIEQSSARSSYGNIKRQTFEMLRTQIYVSPGSWDVEKMAEYTHLTRTYFSSVYKKFFGVSPKRDLIEASLLYAERSLLTGNASVAEIAKRAGYSEHASHFISLFKKKYGLTPEAFKEKNKFNLS